MKIMNRYSDLGPALGEVCIGQQIGIRDSNAGASGEVVQPAAQESNTNMRAIYDIPTPTRVPALVVGQPASSS